MTGRYYIKIGSAAAKQWVSLAYENTLNGMSNAQVALDGVTGGYGAQFDVDSTIDVYKTGVLKFSGTIVNKKDLSAGGVVLDALGIEHELADKKSPMVGSLLTRAWSATSDNTIINTLVTSVSGWTTDVSNSSSSNVDFRTSASESVWNAVIRLISDGGKDIFVDQANKKVYLYDELTRNSQFGFVEGKNAKDITRDKKRSIAGKVLVYGKGDGENQIVGSNGASTPVYTIIDRNVVSTTQANARALVEYNKLNPKQLSYKLTPIIGIDGLRVGDSGDIVNNSAGINETVDITRFKLLVAGNGTEKITLEVTNPVFRLASKNAAEERTKSLAVNNQSQSSMQGSGNTLTWERGVNAKSGTPLAIIFQVPDSFIKDEVGNVQVNSFTVDYDVDPYRKGVGGATDSGHVHSISSTTTDNMSMPSLIDDDTFAVNVDTTFEEVMDVSIPIGTYGFLLVYLQVYEDGWTGLDSLSVDVQYHGTPYFRQNGITINTDLSPLYLTIVIPALEVLGSGTTVSVRLASVGNEDYQGFVEVFDMDTVHNHDITALTGTESSVASVTIGDDVSDAGSINATEVDIYLDFWNGSAWINKHSVLNTGKTLDTDVDITDSGTYPDTGGLWRVRVDPDSADADYLQTIVKMKHELQNT